MACSLCSHTILFSQGDTLSRVFLSGYAETYYGYDFGQPNENNRPGFIYSHNRHNEVNLNLAMLKATFSEDNVRANLAFMAGTYANANLAAEPGVLKNIYEANMGIRLSKKRNLWIDAGVFPSHIGFESAIGKDCKTLTRSMMADNTPYYESGAKVTYVPENGQWMFSGLILNGWQRIQRINGNRLPALGHQITFKPSDRITLNSSSFIGNDFPEEYRRMRYFHNLFGQFQLQKKLSLIIGIDAGMQQNAKGSTQYDKWYTPVAIVYFSPSSKINVAARAEYFSDKNGVIIATGHPDGFQTTGFSLNSDWNISPAAVWRFEFKYMNSQAPLFVQNEQLSRNNFAITTALALAF